MSSLRGNGATSATGHTEPIVSRMFPTTCSDTLSADVVGTLIDPREGVRPSAGAHPATPAERVIATMDAEPARPSTAWGPGVHRFNRIAVFSLALGVLVAMLTTTDATWWGLHFSQLGTYTDFSGRTFNGTVMFSGFFLAAYGVFVVLALPAHTGRRTRRAFRGSVTSAGLHLTVIGMIPIPVSPVMHDIAASGLGLSFLGMVAAALGLPGRSRRFRRATTFCVALLATGMVVLTAGFITLAAFEFVAFVSMGIWLTFLPRALAFEGSTPAAERTHVVERRGRRRAGMRASSRPAARAARPAAVPAPAVVPAHRRPVARRHAVPEAQPWLIERGEPDDGRPAAAERGHRPEQVPRAAALAL